MIIKWYSILFFLVLQNTAFSQYSSKINVVEGLANRELIDCSDFIDDIVYIPLSNEANRFIGQRPEFDICDSLLFVMSKQNCYVFDLSSGSFIREIGRRGRGPGEFRSAKGIINIFSKEIYFLGWNNNLLSYDFNGRFLSSIEIPYYNDSFEDPSYPMDFTCLTDSILVAYYSNFTGDEQKLLVGFNNEGNISFVHRNKNVFKEKKFHLTTKESHFHHFCNNLYFKENYSDTVYFVNTSKMEPAYILYTGKYLKPYATKWGELKVENNNYISPFNLVETDSYLFFKFYFEKKLLHAIYYKKSEILRICDIDGGFRNDIDNFLPINYFDRTSNGELVGYYEAYQIINRLEEKKKFTPDFQNVLKQFNNLKITDNPIIVIAKTKDK